MIATMQGAYWLTRFLFLRLLGVVFVAAFVSLLVQLGPLLGSQGLLPVQTFLTQARTAIPNPVACWTTLPTLFWFNSSDVFLYLLAGVGLALSLLLLAGWANGLLLTILWVIYLSFNHVGQIFYGYGWEIMLLEGCFLAIFWVPWLDARPFPSSPPSRIIRWCFWWLIFRVMFGAGLIKLRGDPCWWDLTCLFYHFETQPIPNPISWYFHQLPPLLLKAGVLWNHLVELVAPWCFLGPRRLRLVAAWLLISFQIFLIISGNLSFLNWLTIALCIPLLDDQALARLLPARWRRAEVQAAAAAQPASRPRRMVIGAVAALLALLSIAPIRNMLSPRQIMNTSFDPLHLMNTYGAFGSVGKVRREIILEGTRDAQLGPETRWQAYGFWAKPGDIHRRPAIIAPFQPRLDWQIWFAAMSTIEQEPWLVHLIAKLLENDRGVLRLLANNPFPEGPPTYLRADLYEYHFTRFGDPPGTWWIRRRLGPYVRPVSRDDPQLRRYLQAYGLAD